MTENYIGLKPISEILGMNFFIPSYQRGYRWTKQQVEDLLNDIWEFSSKPNKSEKEFYCLQPVIIRLMNSEEILEKKLNSVLDNNKWYEVIDGQQRLTTIKILISYLIKKHLNGDSLEREYGRPEFIIDYETRQNTKYFLDNVGNTEANGEDNIDFYHIHEAYKNISEWFETKNQQRAVREGIFRTLVKDMKTKDPEGILQVIWYETKEIASNPMGILNPIDTFIRINMGKIPLTNSELIKALFLQKRNFNGVSADLFQIEIANEWDRMEYALQDDSFWWFLNKNKNEIPARIEFIFDLMCEVAKKENNKLEDKIGNDEHATFRFFTMKFSENNFDESINAWNEIKDYFLAFEEWFNDPVWYHYIGFLIYCGAPIIDIYGMYKNTEKDKFISKIQSKIKKHFDKLECHKSENKYNINLSFENKNKQKIRELLLLFNIESIVKQYKESIKTSGEIFNRFPFEIFKKESWDIEHIDSFTENEVKNKETQIEWLKSAKLDLDLNPELVNQINLFMEDSSFKKSFEEIKSIIVKEAGEDSNNEDDKNSIGNLTLLDAGTNRGYGNALFPTKRRKIIEKDTAGKFIPICTKNVFLKYFDTKGTSRTQWTKQDIHNYQNHIGFSLESFLPFKTIVSNE